VHYLQKALYKFLLIDFCRFRRFGRPVVTDVFLYRKALSTLATTVAEFGDYSCQCGQGLRLFLPTESQTVEHTTS